MRIQPRILIIATLVLCFCVLPVSAVVQEVTVKGIVSATSKDKNTLTIADPARYGCSYPEGGAPVCSYSPLNSSTVTGTVPTSAAFGIFEPGDTVIATSLGGTGGTWMTLAKLLGPGVDEEYVTGIVGDPSPVPAPLAGDYSLDIATTPDCTTCFGTRCTALSADVKIQSSGTLAAKKDLSPRQMLAYSGRNDGSSIAVTFVKGEASSRTCSSGKYDMTGPQPVSVFVIDVVPPVGFASVETTVPITPAEPVQPTQSPTTKAAVLPFAATGALAAAALLVGMRRG